MHLIEVGSHEFFSQSFIVSTYEGYDETREKSNCGLEDVVGIGGAVGIACLHLAQCCRDDQQAMWVVAYPFRRLMKMGRSRVNECTRSGKALRSTTHRSSRPATE